MLITKTPFRISFCGGGSDIPDFYRENGGCVLSTSINKYMYISIHPYFDEEKTALKYSKNEIVTDYKEIQHSIFKQVLSDYDVNGVELVSTADVPSGTGLGSSSSFTVGLIHTLNCYQGKYMSKKDIAQAACEVEIQKLKNPIGKQDQYAAACGGLNFITFHKDDTVSVEPVIMRKETMDALQENLVMFYTGIKHDANAILAEQKKNISQLEKTKNLLKMCDLAKEMKESLEKNDLSDFGNILHENWLLKKELAGGITRPEIDAAYNKALESGAVGGKLLGAGGGGFLLFYCEKYKQKELEDNLGLKRFDFRFEHDGTSVVYIGEKYW
ncbi:MAG: GHMP kinase [Lachnospiraceae bacterium]|nr:GHMP kinase [Lachnospiraceae bacterium]